MDKQKQIEEMAEIALKNTLSYTCAKQIAMNFYNAGYRKTPEGAVVLTGMETEQRFEDLMVAFDEMGFMPNTTHPFPEEYVETWKQRLIFVFGQLRKEMAEKFAERLKEKLEERKKICLERWKRYEKEDETDLACYWNGKENEIHCVKADIYEICKEIIGEEK